MDGAAKKSHRHRFASPRPKTIFRGISILYRKLDETLSVYSSQTGLLETFQKSCQKNLQYTIRCIVISDFKQ